MSGLRFLRRRPTIDLEKYDPLTKAMAPPENETPKEREVRLVAQAESQKRSDAIDEEINRQRIIEKKASKSVRVLLLGKHHHCLESPLIITTLVRTGQSESGKVLVISWSTDH